MSRYEILDLQRIYEMSLSNHKLADRAIKVFAMIFRYKLQGFHKAMMKMGSALMLLNAQDFFLCFDLMTSEAMRQLTLDMMTAIAKAPCQPVEKDWRDVIKIYIVFLQKCIVLKKELEDYRKRPISGEDIEEYIKEAQIKFSLQEIKFCGASCPGCNIF